MTLSAFLAVSSAAALLLLVFTTLRSVVLALRAGGRRDDAVGDRDALAESRFTIPVSVIVPVTDGVPRRADLDGTIADLLALDYPEFEVVVVVDETHASIGELRSRWRLSPHEFFYRQALPAADVRRIFRSATDAHLLVVEKAAAGAGDALNCGVNIARFRYAAIVQPGTRCDRDALLRAMAAPIRDPAGIVAATTHVAAESDWMGALDTARAVLESRVFWRALPDGIGPDCRVAVWRRDAILQMRGFSTTAADPGIDLMARLHSRPLGDQDGGRSVVRTAAVFGSTAIRPPAARRFAAAIQALLTMRHAAGGAAFRTVLGSYVVEPACAFWAVAATAAAAAAGWQPWSNPILAFAAVCFCRAMVSTAALLVRGSSAGAPNSRRLNELVALSPLQTLARSASGLAAWFGAILLLVRARH